MRTIPRAFAWTLWRQYGVGIRFQGIALILLAVMSARARSANRVGLDSLRGAMDYCRNRRHFVRSIHVGDGDVLLRKRLRRHAGARLVLSARAFSIAGQHLLVGGLAHAGGSAGDLVALDCRGRVPPATLGLGPRTPARTTFDSRCGGRHSLLQRSWRGCRPSCGTASGSPGYESCRSWRSCRSSLQRSLRLSNAYPKASCVPCLPGAS